MPKYTEDQYEKEISKLDQNWTKEETDKLFELISIFEGNFLLVKDRWPSNFKERRVEDIKERLFNVCQKIEILNKT